MDDPFYDEPPLADLPPATSEGAAAGDASESTGAAAGTGAASTNAPDADGQAPAASTADGNGNGGAQPSPEPNPLDLSRLEAVALEARQQRASSQPAAPTHAQPQPDLTKLADAMSGGARMREAVEAMSRGDLSKVAEITGVSEATLLERTTEHALKGGSTSVIEDKLSKALERIARLEGRAPKDPDEVPQWYQEQQQRQAHQANQQAFFDVAADDKAHPVLSKLDQADALRYGQEASALLERNGHSWSPEAAAHVAEQLAARRLKGLLAHQPGAPSGNQAGSEESKAAGNNAQPADTGGDDAGGALDNRAASTTAAAMPELDDEEAWERLSASLVQ